MGSSPMFSAALALIVIWGVTGPYFHFSDTWQLVINTATTVITFLMVFLIQNTQNRDARALHLKMDEVIRALHTARNEMIDIERLSDQELEHLSEHYEHIRKASEARKSARREKHVQHAQKEPVLEGQVKHVPEKLGERVDEGLQEKPDEQRKAG